MMMMMMTERARHRQRTRRSPVLAGALVIVLLFALALWPSGGSPSRSATRVTTSPAFFAPSALPGLLSEGLTERPVPQAVAADLLAATKKLPSGYADGCHVDQAATTAPACTYGDPLGSTSVWLIGDSHAEQWLPALEIIGRAQHWKITAINKSACPPVSSTASTTFNNSAYPQCSSWNDYVLARVKAAHPALVIVAALGSEVENQGHSLATYLSALRAASDSVLLLGDTPTPNTDVPTCIATHLDNAAACALDPAVAAPQRAAAPLRAAAAEAGASFQSTTSWFCLSRGCPVIIDTTLMYRDNSHLSVVASQKYAPVLAQALRGHDPRLP